MTRKIIGQVEIQLHSDDAINLYYGKIPLADKTNTKTKLISINAFSMRCNNLAAEIKSTNDIFARYSLIQTEKKFNDYSQFLKQVNSKIEIVKESFSGSIQVKSESSEPEVIDTAKLSVYGMLALRYLSELDATIMNVISAWYQTLYSKKEMLSIVGTSKRKFRGLLTTPFLFDKPLSDKEFTKKTKAALDKIELYKKRHLISPADKRSSTELCEYFSTFVEEPDFL